MAKYRSLRNCVTNLKDEYYIEVITDAKEKPFHSVETNIMIKTLNKSPTTKYKLKIGNQLVSDNKHAHASNHFFCFNQLVLISCE